MQSWWWLSACIPPSANVGLEITSKGKRIRKGSAPVERQRTPAKNISFPGSCLGFLCFSNVSAFTLEPGTLFMVWDKTLNSYYQWNKQWKYTPTLSTSPHATFLVFHESVGLSGGVKESNKFSCIKSEQVKMKQKVCCMKIFKFYSEMNIIAFSLSDDFFLD